MRSLSEFKMRLVWMGVFCVGFVGPSLGQRPVEDGIWTTKSPMQRARLVLSSGVVDGKIYAIGGSPDLPGIAWVEEYDPGTDTWAWKTDMPTARSTATSSVVNGKIYVIGGRTGLNGVPLPTVEQFDPATDTWTTKANMPTTRSFVSSSVVDGKIYVFGGALSYQGTPLSTVEQYDPATDTWTSKADMPTARVNASASAVNGRIYLIGGAPGGGQWYQGLSTVQEYDPATDTWTTKADMPTARTYLSTSEVNGRVYAIGGIFGNSSAFSTVEAYDPATDTWMPKADMPTERFRMTTSVVDGKIYAIGGSARGGGPNAITTVEAYDPYPLVVDFNGDFKVDIEDLVVLIECWSTDEPLCDIAPKPLGDGIVDRADLELLMGSWGQELDDPGLMALWKLDETAGDIAYDSAATHDAVVIGDAMWQPQGGQADGALSFDGIDDYVQTPRIMNPADGVFSAFAWVRGGAPSQVILSQVDGAAWFILDSQGNLKTTLKSGTRMSGLASEAAIADDNWHRIGFAWDGSERVLYVDDVEVARDESDNLTSCKGNLYIGAGSGLEEGSFWSGLIDDVRIHNRVVEP